jgi:hypothetical protein
LSILSVHSFSVCAGHVAEQTVFTAPTHAPSHAVEQQ